MKECIIGIDFGKTNVRFAVAEEQPELKYFTKRPYVRGSPDELHEQIFEGIDAALEEAGYDREGLRGIGMCVPAVVNRGALQLAISTAGMSPALAKRIGQRLEKEFGSYYEDFLASLAELRQQVKEKYPQDQERRGAILSGFVDSAALELLQNGKVEQFRELLESWKNRPD